jgi:agmatine deiminase
MPAEWAHHEAVWTAWPYLDEQWSEGLDAPQRALMQMCTAIVDLDDQGRGRGERVELLVRNQACEDQARLLLGAAAVGVQFHQTNYGDIWLRDTGPLFVTRRDGANDEISAARFRFDGWGGKYLMDGDAGVSQFVLHMTRHQGAAFDFVLEGGAVEVDGTGTIMTTKQCLLGGARNPGLTQSAIEARLCWALGGNHIIWLDQGLINDHTDGHIDTIARFVAPGVVACMEPKADDPNRDAMTAIMADLRRATDVHGTRIEVVTVPSPGAIVDAGGSLTPASYMNFYIANTTVVVPVYGCAADETAVDAIAAMFPNRRTVAADGKSVVIGGGAFHCATQQQPSGAR